ncbi:MAG: hypothetical protein FD166_846 [Bacteroidetes bacterium]|nr:MAG: hypothetical protein FD166_846 [Bacteroidota bacterium]
MKRNLLLVSLVMTIGLAWSCSKSEDNNPADTPGPKFLAAKSVITGSCALSGCHVAPANAGGFNFESNSSIVSAGSQIKSLAVDFGTMPPTGALSASDKAKISEWISAGGRLTD